MDLGVVPRVTPCTFTVDRHRRVHVDLGHDGTCSFFATRRTFPTRIAGSAASSDTAGGAP